MTNLNWNIFENKDELFSNLASYIYDLQKDKDDFFMTCCGGSTPAPLYKDLNERIKKQNKDKEKLVIVTGDERCVPYTDQRSNYKLLQDIFAEYKILSLYNNDYEYKENNLSFDEMDNYINPFTASLIKSPVAFDLNILGMGLDGHFASIFPNDPNIDEAFVKNERDIHKVISGSPDVQRLSINVEFIRKTNENILLITGKEKKKLIEEGDEKLPIKKLLQEIKVKIFYCD